MKIYAKMDYTPLYEATLQGIWEGLKQLYSRSSSQLVDTVDFLIARYFARPLKNVLSKNFIFNKAVSKYCKLELKKNSYRYVNIRNNKIEIERIFTEPRFTHNVGQEKSIKASDLLQEKDDILFLLGSPGSGKSTAVRWLYRRFCSSLLESKGKQKQLPIFLDNRFFQEHLNSFDLEKFNSKKEVYQLFHEIFHKFCPSFYEDVPLNSVQYILEEQGVSIFMDNIDELGSDLQNKLMDFLYLISTTVFSTTSVGNRVFIALRDLTFKDLYDKSIANSNHNGFMNRPVFTLGDLRGDNLAEFIKKYSSIYATIKYDQAILLNNNSTELRKVSITAGKLSESIYSSLELDKNLNELILNRFMLSLIIDRYYDLMIQSELNNSNFDQVNNEQFLHIEFAGKSKLYTELIHRIHEGENNIPIRHEDLMLILGKICYDNIFVNKLEIINTFKIDLLFAHQDIVNHHENFDKKIKSSMSILKHIEYDKLTMTFQFTHTSFIEYYAGWYLTHFFNYDKWEELLQESLSEEGRKNNLKTRFQESLIFSLTRFNSIDLQKSMRAILQFCDWSFITASFFEIPPTLGVTLLNYTKDTMKHFKLNYTSQDNDHLRRNVIFLQDLIKFISVIHRALQQTNDVEIQERQLLLITNLIKEEGPISIEDFIIQYAEIDALQAYSILGAFNRNMIKEFPSKVVTFVSQRAFRNSLILQFHTSVEESQFNEALFVATVLSEAAFNDRRIAKIFHKSSVPEKIQTLTQKHVLKSNEYLPSKILSPRQTLYLTLLDFALAFKSGTFEKGFNKLPKVRTIYDANLQVFWIRNFRIISLFLKPLNLISLAILFSSIISFTVLLLLFALKIEGPWRIVQVVAVNNPLFFALPFFGIIFITYFYGFIDERKSRLLKLIGI